MLAMAAEGHSRHCLLQNFKIRLDAKSPNQLHKGPFKLTQMENIPALPRSVCVHHHHLHKTAHELCCLTKAADKPCPWQARHAMLRA